MRLNKLACILTYPILLPTVPFFLILGWWLDRQATKHTSKAISEDAK
jgi:hypothetical protein